MRRTSRLSASLTTACALATSACASGALERLADEPSLATSVPATSSPSPPAKLDDDAAVTRSPWPLDDEVDPRARELARRCGAPDGAIERVAREVARLRARGLGAPDGDRVASLLRARGVPHVRPRVLAATGNARLDDATLESRVEALASPLARCGVAIAKTPHGGEVVVAVAVDALADLSPLPRRARMGEWLTVEAKLHVPARAARVLVTGARGQPRSVPASLDPRGVVRARFSLERPGAYLVQVVGDVEGGPRPLLEARVGSGEPADDDDAPAPGEETTTADNAADASALERMVRALRASEGLPPLARDARLDALARTHAAAMARAGVVAHDVGEGDLRGRAARAGADLERRRLGENVARAVDVARAHRALHASPSHRANLLDSDYTHVGIGVARGEDGSVYACQVFAAE